MSVCLSFASGHGEWEDGTQVRLRIMWKTSAEWAAEIYKYVSRARAASLAPRIVPHDASLRLCSAFALVAVRFARAVNAVGVTRYHRRHEFRSKYEGIFVICWGLNGGFGMIWS